MPKKRTRRHDNDARALTWPVLTRPVTLYVFRQSGQWGGLTKVTLWRSNSTYRGHGWQSNRFRVRSQSMIYVTGTETIGQSSGISSNPERIVSEEQGRGSLERLASLPLKRDRRASYAAGSGQVPATDKYSWMVEFAWSIKWLPRQDSNLRPAD